MITKQANGKPINLLNFPLKIETLITIVIVHLLFFTIATDASYNNDYDFGYKKNIQRKLCRVG